MCREELSKDASQLFDSVLSNKPEAYEALTLGRAEECNLALAASLFCLSFARRAERQLRR